MTRLEAVNRVLTGAGQPPAFALGSGQASMDAERILNECLYEIQSREPWYYNTHERVSLSPTKLAASGAAWTVANRRLTLVGAFATAAVGQTVEIAGAVASPGAAGVTAYTADYIALDREIDPGDQTGVSVTATDGPIVLSDGQIVFVRSEGPDTWRKVTGVGRRLYDLENRTEVFGASVMASYRLAYDVGCLPEPVAQYICDVAAVRMIETSRFGDRALHGVATGRMRSSMQMARSFNCDQGDFNMNDTDAPTVLGGRLPNRIRYLRPS